MIKHTPFQAAYKAVYDILSTKQTTLVYASIPTNAEYPCITLENQYSFDDNGAKDTDITDITLYIDLWSDDTSQKEIQELVDDVRTVLTSWELEFSPAIYRAIDQNAPSGIIEPERDAPWTYHAVLTFKAKIQYIGG